MKTRTKMLATSVIFTALSAGTFWAVVLPIDDTHRQTAKYQNYEQSRVSYYIENGTQKELAALGVNFAFMATAAVTLYSFAFGVHGDKTEA